MKKLFSKILDTEVKVRARILTDKETLNEEGKLEVRDVPAFYAAVATINAKELGSRISSKWNKVFGPVEPVVYDPEIHPDYKFGDTVYFNQRIYVVWAVRTEPDVMYRLARITSTRGIEPGSLADRWDIRQVVLTKDNSAVVDRVYIAERDYMEITADVHKHKFNDFE